METDNGKEAPQRADNCEGLRKGSLREREQLAWDSGIPEVIEALALALALALTLVPAPVPSPNPSLMRRTNAFQMQVQMPMSIFVPMPKKRKGKERKGREMRHSVAFGGHHSLKQTGLLSLPLLVTLLTKTTVTAF